jgi:hypothetical protein
MGGRRRLRYPSNVDTVASVSLSQSDSPARASSTTLTATSSTTGVAPVSSNRAQACLNARFIASLRCLSSSTLTSPGRLALCGHYRLPKGRECELLHTPLRCAQENSDRLLIGARARQLIGRPIVFATPGWSIRLRLLLLLARLGALGR